MNNTISIVIPTYNRPTELLRAINSILNQKYRELFEVQVVIINDGSTVSYASVFPVIQKHNFVYISNNRNCGVSSARNIGIEHAIGDWILFLDDDDELIDNYCATLMDEIENYPLVACFWSGVRVVNDQGSFERRFFTNNKDYTYFVKDFLSIGLSHGVAIKKKVLCELGMFCNAYEVGEDTDLFIRLMKNKWEIKVLDVLAVIKHENQHSRLSFGFKKYSEQSIYERLFLEHHKFFMQFPYVYVNLMLWAYRVHLMNKNYVKADNILQEILSFGYPLDHVMDCFHQEIDLAESYLKVLT